MTPLESVLIELESYPLFKDFDRQQLALFCEGGKVQFTSHREILYHEGDSADTFAIVLSGAYKLFKSSPKGEDVIMHFSTPGDVIGALIMSRPGSTYPVSSVSMGPSRVIKVPRSVYTTAWMKEKELVFRVQLLLSNRMSGMQDQKMLNRASLDKKIASLMMRLLDQNDSPKALEIPLPLTRKEIADTLSASVESVIRIMSDWSKKGLIETIDQQIKILRPDKLLEILNT